MTHRILTANLAYILYIPQKNCFLYNAYCGDLNVSQEHLASTKNIMLDSMCTPNLEIALKLRRIQSPVWEVRIIYKLKVCTLPWLSSAWSCVPQQPRKEIFCCCNYAWDCVCEVCWISSLMDLLSTRSRSILAARRVLFVCILAI